MLTECWLQTPPNRSDAAARMKTVHDIPAPTNPVCGEGDVSTASVTVSPAECKCG
jgi:hypothetical protein